MIDTKEILWKFAEELNARMIENGVTYRQVAYAARVTKGSVVHYKSGNTFPEPWTLALIADYLGCSVDELLGYPNPHIFARTRRWIPAIERFPNWDAFADYFRERLSDLMNAKHMTAEELAKNIGASTRTIDMYLSVHRWTPDTPSFLRICDALDCTPSDLLGY